MNRRLPGACCAVVLLAVCGCARPTTIASAGGTRARSAGANGGLSLITEPRPGDQPFVALIDSARHSVRVTMYELGDRRVELALAGDAGRGVRVMVLLDHGQYGAGRPSNQAAYSYLRDHHVTVA